jgi:FrmR/RcnR family transcriptional regulator, repressor of frmRAB operon
VTHVKDKIKLLNRIRRMRGQLDAVAAGIDQDSNCTTILQTLVSCRGALNGLVVEMFADHMNHHVVDPRRRPTKDQTAAAREMVDLLRTCL